MTIIESINTSQNPTAASGPIAVGSLIHVRTRFVGAWSDGFVVAEHVDQGCLIRRISDGSVFPDVFAWYEIRSASPGRHVA